MEVLCQLKLHKNRLWRLQKTFFLCMLWLLNNKTTPAVWAHYSRTCLPIWLHFTSTYGTDKCFYIAACVFDKWNLKLKSEVWRWKLLVRIRLYLSASGRRTGHISLWPLLQALHIHTIHHTSQAWLRLQLQNKTHRIIIMFPVTVFQTSYPSCHRQRAHWYWIALTAS